MSTAARQGEVMSTAAAVVCFDADWRILLVEGPRGVALPCGKVEPGECASAAAVREAREETGVEVTLYGVPYINFVDGHRVSAWAARPADPSKIGPPRVMERGLRPFWGWPADMTGAFTLYNLAAVAHATAQFQAGARTPGELAVLEALLALEPSARGVCLLASEWGVRVPLATLERLGATGAPGRSR